MDRSLNPSSSSMQNTVLSRESSSNEDDIPQIKSSKNAISTPASLIQAFVVVSLLATPIVFLPYIPLRRRLSSMTEQITTLRSLNEELLRRSSMVHAYGGRQGILLEQTRDELRKHRHLSGDRLGSISRELGAARKQLKEVQSSSDERIKGMGAEIASLKEQLAAVEEKKDGLDA
ncbi:hypothetical protein FRC02_007673 [Tulasnella sp. 418]|nr:hypothetical protein FRC02_007673 [Tulasnella sp. 418]